MEATWGWGMLRGGVWVSGGQILAGASDRNSSLPTLKKTLITSTQHVISDIHGNSLMLTAALWFPDANATSVSLMLTLPLCPQLRRLL